MVRTSLVVCLLTATVSAAEPVSIPFGTLKGTAPTEWVSVKPANRLRSHQFKLAGPEGTGDAEIIVSPQRSPDPMKEFPTWKAQYTPPDGKTPSDVTKESKLEPSGAVVHLLDVSGTWKFKEFPQSKKEEVRSEYRTVWAIVVVKDEASHVRFSGPQSLVAKHYTGFEAFLKSLK